MLAFVAAVLFATLPRPAALPDAKTIDAVTFHLGPGGCLQTGGALTIKADGKVSYFHQINMCMNHNDPVHKAEWEIPAKEAAAVIRQLVADGVLELPLRIGYVSGVAFTVSSGRWKAYYYAVPVPEKLMAVLMPYLQKAHPELWKPVPAKRETLPTKLTRLEYAFFDPAAGHMVTVTLNREGTASYSRRDWKAAPTLPPLKVEVWNLEGKDASVKLLDALYTAGIADLPDDINTPLQHQLDLSAGAWRWTIHSKEMPEPIRKILQPLLDKAALPKK